MSDNRPRFPSVEETTDLINYQLRLMCPHNAPLQDDLETAEHLVQNAHVAVFDNYVSDGPGYVGRVMMVVWGGGPGFYELYTWDRDDNIVREEQER